MNTQPNTGSSNMNQRNSEAIGLQGEHHQRMNGFSEDQPGIPSLKDVRSSVSSGITQIVEFFLDGNHRSAHVDEIVDGIQIENEAEKESVYSIIDPYTDGAAKRDERKPLLFRRTSPGQFEFLGFNDDPLDLTKKLTFRNDLLREAYSVFCGMIRKIGKEAEFKSKSTSERIQAFHTNLQKAPSLLEIAADNLRIRQSIVQLKL
jgi:hypothetical protein